MGSNNHSMKFEGCVFCANAEGCGTCRKSLQLKGTHWKILLEDGAAHDDTEMPKGTRIVVEDSGYGLGTIDGFRANDVGANNHCVRFDNCQSCAPGGGGCKSCRKSLQLRGMRWKMLRVNGSVHDDTQLPKGTRVAVENVGYGLATIDGFRSNLIGANNHSMVFDNCQSCSGVRGGCGSCRKSLQLKGTPWKILLKDGSSHDDTQMPVGTRVLVENAAYGVATISGFTSALFGANTHEMVFDNCPACAQKRKKGCSLCRKALKLKGIEWSQLDRSELAQRARAQPRWVEDDEQQVCMLCDAEFGSMTRQHHCRCCGWVVCAGCCPEGQMIELDRWVSSSEGHPIKRAAQVAGTPTKHKRVCNICLRAAPLEVEERRRALAGVDEGIPPA